jgi:hypothetical protein
LRVDETCPGTLGRHDGVTNTDHQLVQEMVPPRPTSALICRFHETPGTVGAPPQPGVLYRQVRIGTTSAAELAIAVDGVNTSAPPNRPVNCPAASFGTATILVFGYARSSVDLWYLDTGCQTLDNGVIGASESTEPSFGTFTELLDRLAPST